MYGFGLGDLMGKDRVPIGNKWRMIMEQKDEDEMRIPVKEMNEEMMEAMIWQKKLLIQKRIPFGEGEWGGYIKDEEKVSQATGGGYQGRQLVERLRTVRVMQDDGGRGVYIEAVTAFNKKVTAFCHSKEVQVNCRREERHDIGCDKKGYLFLKSRNMEEVVLEDELYIKPSHKIKYSQQCEMMKAKVVAGEMWLGLECQSDECSKHTWRAQQLAENFKKGHKGDHMGGFQ